jgi:hypothetical protein
MGVDFDHIFASIGVRAVHVNPQNLVDHPTAEFFPNIAMVHVPRPEFNLGGGGRRSFDIRFLRGAFLFMENGTAEIECTWTRNLDDPNATFSVGRRDRTDGVPGGRFLGNALAGHDLFLNKKKGGVLPYGIIENTPAPQNFSVRGDFRIFKVLQAAWRQILSGCVSPVDVE